MTEEMTEELSQVAPLTKISLILTAGSAKDRMDLTPDPLPLSFIYGIGKTGLTPFEAALANKSRGESIAFQVERARLPAFFEHIRPPLTRWGDADMLHFNIRIEDISAVSGREMVSAMAAMAEGCSCGCGCGGHEASHDGCGGGGGGHC